MLMSAARGLHLEHTTPAHSMATLPFPPSAVASTSRHLVVASGSTLHLLSNDNAVSSAAPEAEASIKTNTTGLVRRLAISPDNSVVVSAGDDKTLRVWDIEGGLMLRSTRWVATLPARTQLTHTAGT